MINLQTWKRAWSLLDQRERRQAWVSLLIVILAGLSSALMVGSVLPFLSVLSNPSQIEKTPALTWAYKTFGFTDSYTFLVALGLASFGIIVVASVIQVAKTYVVSQFAMMRIHSISHRLLIAYLRQPYTFFLNRHTGEMSMRVLKEAEQVVVLFLRPAAELIAATCTALMILGLIFWLYPIVTLTAFAVFGGSYGLVYIVCRRAIKRQGTERARANEERFRIVNEALSGIKDIKLLGCEESYAARYAGPSHTMARALVGIELHSQTPQFVMQAVAFGGIILLCLILMTPSELKLGVPLGAILPTLGVFAFAGQRLMPEMSRVYQSLAQIRAGSVAVDIVYDDLMEKASSGSLIRVIDAGIGLRECMEFDNVSFRYPNSDSGGLQGLSFAIKAGDRIGIVGATGAGKTTLADLILGLLSPTAGSIMVDKTALTNQKIRAWQKSVGYVPQDIFLIDASVSENIALGMACNEIDDVRVSRAARIAQIDSFIREELSDGYSSTIGERGVRLSGGQRQRIGIARALYHNADLIVFDEATSALDNLTEREVMKAIDALPGDKTVVMIAHRLSTIKSCDKIIVLENGRLVGFDTWHALMNSNKAFQKIANLTDLM